MDICIQRLHLLGVGERLSRDRIPLCASYPLTLKNLITYCFTYLEMRRRL